MTPTQSITIDHAELERLAREICDTRNGAGHYDVKGTKRNHWRALALSAIERERGLDSMDALMAVFGMKRVAE